MRIPPIPLSFIPTGSSSPCTDSLGNCILAVSLLRDSDPYRARGAEPPHNLRVSKLHLYYFVMTGEAERSPAFTHASGQPRSALQPEAMSESTTSPDQHQLAPAPPPAESGSESRQDLLSRAQAFLTSPQVRDQDDVSKRKFLTDKGLTPAEVDYLLQGIVSGCSRTPTYVSSADIIDPACRCSRIESPMSPHDRTPNRRHRIYLSS